MNKWIVLLLFSLEASAATKIKIGSKNFTEGILLGDMATLLVQKNNVEAEHIQGLGGSRVLWDALRSGHIDIYAEYTGTLSEELLKNSQLRNLKDFETELLKLGIGISRPLGFNNTYAFGLKKKLAEKMQLKTMSDLRKNLELKFGFSNEFLARNDGWKAIQARYQLPHKNITGLDHDLAYEGLRSGKIDITDIYTTDAEIARYELVALEDDLNFFPKYEAVFLYKIDRVSDDIVASLNSVHTKVNEEKMSAMNSAVKIEKKNSRSVAAEFLNTHTAQTGFSQNVSQTKFGLFVMYTVDHLKLFLLSLIGAIVWGIPLGIVAAARVRAAKAILGVTAVIQTIPSLALLVLMIPLLGIGFAPAFFALFLYSLLPIVRGTYLGLTTIPLALAESAQALGLPYKARLRFIDLPLATNSILSGIKTSAVINVGTATLGALIGAGGYGQPILSGIRLSDTSQILMGAIPSAILALLVQFLFDRLEAYLTPAGLKDSL